MAAVNMAETRIRIDELLEQAGAGEDIVIVRQGKPDVKLVRSETPSDSLQPSEPRKRIDVDRLRRLTDSQKIQTQSAVELVRWMRDEDGY